MAARWCACGLGPVRMTSHVRGHVAILCGAAAHVTPALAAVEMLVAAVARHSVGCGDSFHAVVRILLQLVGEHGSLVREPRALQGGAAAAAEVGQSVPWRCPHDVPCHYHSPWHWELGSHPPEVI